MSIITNQPPDPWIKKVDEKEKIKEEIRGEVISEMKKKKHKKFFTCCFLKLLIVILILGGIAATVARTGIIDIPVFSKLFYKTPTPERVVSVDVEEKNFENILSQKIEQQIKLNKISEADTQKVEVTLDFTEEELTSFLKGAEGTENFPFADSQISISPDGLEIFGQLKELNETFLTVVLKPEVTDGDFKISFKEIKIGNLSLPPVIGNFLVDKFLKDRIDSIKQTISKNGNLKSIDLSDGKILLHGLIDATSFVK